MNPAAAERLRVLVVDEALPYPADSGKRLRTWHLLRRLARRHAVELLCYGAGGEASAGAVAALEGAGIRCHLVAPPAEAAGAGLYARLLANCFSPWPYSVAKHHSRRLRGALEELWRTGRFDLVQIEWTPYASHLGPDGPPHLIASHNIEAHIWRRRAEVGGNAAARLYFRLQAAKMEGFERRAFRRARAVTAVSAGDRDEALRWGARRASVVANGVDLEQFQPRGQAPTPDRMLFVGALDWFPNHDAVVHFVEEMMPLIRARRPQAHLQVIGRRPSAGLRQRLQGRAGVELVGEVDDIRPRLAEAAVVVVPLRVGGGSRIKIIEALAMAKAVVATTVGAEGLELRSGTHLLLADGAQQFARLAAQLLATPAQAEQLGQAGRRWVQEHHDWDDCAQALEAAWRASAARGPSEAGAA